MANSENVTDLQNIQGFLLNIHGFLQNIHDFCAKINANSYFSCILKIFTNFKKFSNLKECS